MSWLDAFKVYGNSMEPKRVEVLTSGIEHWQKSQGNQYMATDITPKGHGTKGDYSATWFIRRDINKRTMKLGADGRYEPTMETLALWSRTDTDVKKLMMDQAEEAGVDLRTVRFESPDSYEAGGWRVMMSDSNRLLKLTGQYTARTIARSEASLTGTPSPLLDGAL